jgi:hypothetical protein
VADRTKWVLLLYGLPTKKGAVRTSVWRQLRKCGALALKTSAYLLPDTPEHTERFQWLAQQVRDGGGEATLIHATDIEGLTNEELARMFNEARAKDYDELIGDLRQWQRKGKKQPPGFEQEVERMRARLEEIRRVDFFNCPRVFDAELLLSKLSGAKAKVRKAPVLSPREYRKKAWLTRPRPGIDRVGSAWLIRRFIDAEAKFVFSPDPKRHPTAIPFDMMGVEFSHHGDDCTFETLVKRFRIEDRTVRQMAEMVHDADLEDGKFQRHECVGIDRLLNGWARQGMSDDELLAKGGECFNGLYEALRK